MDKLYLGNTGGDPIFLDDLDRIMNSLIEGNFSVFKALSNGGANCFVFGCAITTISGGFHVATGYLIKSGELIKVDAHDYIGIAPCSFNRIETNDPTGYDQFQDGNYHNKYIKVRAVLQSGSGGMATTSPTLLGLLADNLRTNAFPTYQLPASNIGALPQSKITNLISDLATITGNISTINGQISTLQTDVGNRVIKNSLITGSTKCRISFDSKGLVTAGYDLYNSDLPVIDTNKYHRVYPFGKRIDAGVTSFQLVLPLRNYNGFSSNDVTAIFGIDSFNIHQYIHYTVTFYGYGYNHGEVLLRTDDYVGLTSIVPIVTEAKYQSLLIFVSAISPAVLCQFAGVLEVK